MAEKEAGQVPTGSVLNRIFIKVHFSPVYSVLGADRGDFLRSKVESGVSTVVIFDDPACQRIEERIDEVCRTADRGGYRVCTVDRARLRNKSVNFFLSSLCPPSPSTVNPYRVP